MNTLDLRDHDTLTMAEFTAILSERWQADEDIDAVIVLPAVAEQWKADKRESLRNRIDLLESEAVDPEYFGYEDMTGAEAIAMLERTIEYSLNPPSIVKWTDLVLTPFGQCKIIPKERGAA